MIRNKVDRIVLADESIVLSKAAVKNPMTRDLCERRLINFLNAIIMKPDEFVENARTSPSDAEKNIISYLTSQNARLGKGEITAADVGNALKVIKLLLEMNDVTLNWKGD